MIFCSSMWCNLFFFFGIGMYDGGLCYEKVRRYDGKKWIWVFSIKERVGSKSRLVESW